jgi:hypothetical protein
MFVMPLCLFDHCHSASLVRLCACAGRYGVAVAVARWRRFTTDVHVAPVSKRCKL